MGTRIARIYESLSTHQMSTGRAEQAADSLKRAIECYQMEDDKRYLGLISSLADLEASRNRYVEAERLFDSLLHSSEPAFAFRRSDFVLSRGLCLLAIACSDDSGTTPLADVQSLLSGEAESRQTELLAKLLQAFNNSDRDEWNRVVDDYARRSVIDGWRLQLLRQLPEQFNELR
jgi:tetratricopeptide (TPR) repeat protein